MFQTALAHPSLASPSPSHSARRTNKPTGEGGGGGDSGRPMPELATSPSPPPAGCAQKFSGATITGCVPPFVLRADKNETTCDVGCSCLLPPAPLARTPCRSAVLALKGWGAGRCLSGGRRPPNLSCLSDSTLVRVDISLREVGRDAVAGIGLLDNNKLWNLRALHSLISDNLMAHRQLRMRIPSWSPLMAKCSDTEAGRQKSRTMNSLFVLLDLHAY